MLFECKAGWGSSMKLLETQKQLQEKKMSLQNAKVSVVTRKLPLNGSDLKTI